MPCGAPWSGLGGPGCKGACDSSSNLQAAIRVEQCIFALAQRCMRAFQARTCGPRAGGPCSATARARAPSQTSRSSTGATTCRSRRARPWRCSRRPSPRGSRRAREQAPRAPAWLSAGLRARSCSRSCPRRSLPRAAPRAASRRRGTNPYCLSDGRPGALRCDARPRARRRCSAAALIGGAGAQVPYTANLTLVLPSGANLTVPTNGTYRGSSYSPVVRPALRTASGGCRPSRVCKRTTSASPGPCGQASKLCGSVVALVPCCNTETLGRRFGSRRCFSTHPEALFSDVQIPRAVAYVSVRGPAENTAPCALNRSKSAPLSVTGVRLRARSRCTRRTWCSRR
jgi:hypothetical protein